MLQARLAGKQRFELIQTEKPVPGPGEALIKVAVAGICGTDLHAFHDSHPFITLPVVPGHEFSGVVEALGNGVPEGRLAPGDKVCVEPSLVCGQCFHCREGRYNICEELKVIGCQTDGAFGEYIAVPWEKVIPLDDKMPFEDAAMLEPLAVAVHAVKKGLTSAGKRVLVIGGGVIGLLLAQAAKAAGAVVAVADILEYRLQVARTLGIPHTIHTATRSLKDAIHAIHPDGMDIIYECVGLPSTVRQSVEIARKGSRIVIVGVVNDDVLLPVNLIQDRELELIGDLMYTKEDFADALALVNSNKVQLQPLKTKAFTIDKVQQAFEYLDDNKDKAFKVFITIASE
ncbi:zinc-dependent alcohol dehydrogenase [Paenibacillus cisolokensis]|uniref:zinc-dependent alcohol dehydrogenase n=1 Tax=Paenibacillus cisolokensis TaxID=1658519 RepID=UPI001BCF8FFC|nr:alcohol dehydrogenase catalytic domain-containing protein [Paenibacillus cisolokensis]